MTNIHFSDTEEQELYRRLSKQMRKGLKQIYKEITTASSDPQSRATQTDQLLHEASAQLSEVLNTTQDATESIMDIVEMHMDLQMEAAGILDSLRQGTAQAEQIERLAAINNTLGNDLTTVMTTLSFQDLTGQRIKKVVDALHTIEDTVIELYVSSGLIIKGREENPSKSIEDLEEEAQAAVQALKDKKSPELKGPTKDGCSQNAIDDLLAQLGMD